MSIEWLMLLLPVAAVSGWLAGRSWTKKSISSNQLKISTKYIVGLNYLLNEQPDKAIDTFIQLLEVDSETVETHLALGSLFRKRGEVDRALRLHQNIIARPILSQEFRQLAMFELGLDYFSAGMLDRAEYIFEDLKEVKYHNISSLQQLLIIYQATKEWQKAVIVAHQLQKLSDQDLRVTSGHFYCELADQAVASERLEMAQGFLKKAQKVDKHSVRASLLQAQLAIEGHQWKDAIKCYKHLMVQDIHFFSESIAGLRTCFDALNRQKGFKKLLLAATDKGAGATVMLAAAKCIVIEKGDRIAAEYISQKLREAPSIKGLQALIELHLLHSTDKAKDSLELLREVVNHLLLNKPSHRCGRCGFESKQLYWLCPSCKNWGTIKPILGIEGK